MNISKIKIKGFKSIYNELELDFKEINGFWKISGNVGAGKTTIGEAIIFGLFGNIKGKNNGDLISWETNQCIIEIWCNSKGNDLYVKRELKRSGSSPLYVEINNEPLIFTNKKDAQNQLETEYYDISRITLELLCIISFNNFKSLSSLNTSETKKFLDEVFGFYILTDYSTNCKEQLTTANSLLSTLKNDYNNIEHKIEYINKLSNIERVSGNVNDLNRQKSDIESELKSVKDKRSNETKLLQTKLIEQSQQSSNIKLIGKKLASEISLIKSGTCPTCGSIIDTSLLPEKEKERETLLKSYNDSETKVKEIEQEISKCNNEFNKQESALQQKIIQINSQIVKLNEQIKRDTVNTEEITLLQKQLSDKQEQITKQEIECKDWTELNTIITNEIRSKILSSFIPRINSSIKKYALQLNQPYIIEFDNTFKCSIKLLNIENNIPISSLSTGQLKTVDMCIILGILDVIMSNVNFNICFLDELFSNMDADLRQIMCQVLKNNIKPEQILFIISHIELDDKYFNGEIKAELEYINDSILKKSKYTINKL